MLRNSTKVSISFFHSGNFHVLKLSNFYGAVTPYWLITFDVVNFGLKETISSGDNSRPTSSINKNFKNYEHHNDYLNSTVNVAENMSLCITSNFLTNSSDFTEFFSKFFTKFFENVWSIVKS